MGSFKFIYIIIFAVIGFLVYLYNNWQRAIGSKSNNIASILIILLTLISIPIKLLIFS